MLQWNGTLTWVTLLSAVMFVGSIVVVWILIVRMPTDYFTRDHLPEHSFRYRHPLFRTIWRVTRNSIGLILVLIGLVMLLTPGQGILCIFIGLTMIDFPRKRDFICRMLRRRAVRSMINRIRLRAGQPPLRFPRASRRNEPAASLWNRAPMEEK